MTLTPRQLQIVRLLCDDKCRKEIAAVLKLCVKTVDWHLWKILKLANKNTVPGLTAWAIKKGIVK